MGAFARYLVLTLAAGSALLPGYVMVTGSLKTQEQFLDSPLSLPVAPSLAAYGKAFSQELWLWMLNTVTICAVAVALTVTIAAFAAWGFANYAFRGRDLVLAGVVSLTVVPPVVLLIPLFTMGSRLGLISTFRFVVLAYVGLMLPFSIFMLASFFRSIPKSLVEAARMDGAGEVWTFWHVVVPLSKSSLGTISVINLLWAWNELLLALVLLQDQDKKTLMVGIASLQGRFSLDIPTLMASMTIVVVPLVVAYLVSQRWLIAGLTAGALKGE